MKHLTEAQLNEYLDDELDGDGQREAAAHLERCDSCRAALSRLEGVQAALAGLPEEAPADDISRAVLARMPEGRLSCGWKAVLAAQAGVLLGVGMLAMRYAGEWVRPQVWLEQALGVLMRLELPLAEAPLRMPRLEMEGPPALLALLAGSALVLWGVGNAILLGGRREVQK
jgi:hypothetical protein